MEDKSWVRNWKEP